MEDAENLNQIFPDFTSVSYHPALYGHILLKEQGSLTWLTLMKATEDTQLTYD